MSQPPQNPVPGDPQWQDPDGGQGPSGPGTPADPYGNQQPPPSFQKPAPEPAGAGAQQPPPYGGQQPPPYGGQQQPYGQQPYGQQPGGGLPGYAGPGGGYADPAAGLASRWARLGAAIVDTVLLAIVIGLLSAPFVNWDRVINPKDGDVIWVESGQWAGNLIGIVLAFLYYWLMTAKWGQTLGKKLLGIRVVREEDRGAIDNNQALGRAAFYSVLGGICGCIGLIDVLWLLWDDRKQCLHDKVAKSVVVKVNPGDRDPYAGR